MKVRYSHVTNSSSSSFVISTKQEVPDRYKDEVKRITKENVLDVIKDFLDYACMGVTWYMDDDEFQKLGNFTDEQMVLIRLAANDRMKMYSNFMGYLDENEDPLYHIYVDRDWLYRDYQYYLDSLQDFIDDSKLLFEEGDL